MKVLSIKEPYATLIKEKKKFIETRSWKTDYRGELYIHASNTKIPKDKFSNPKFIQLIDNIKLNYGYIICKGDLVDCIYMTKEYIENIKNNNPKEYICGIYEEGRYAWVLENIKILKKPIKAKGQLNIWNYYNENETLSLMENINYGWIDKYAKKHSLINKENIQNYILQSPKETIKNKIGISWDQVELERYYLKNNNLKIKTFLIACCNQKAFKSHVFLTFEKNNKYFWFEHAWEKFKGIHQYKSIEELLSDVQEKFIKYKLNENKTKKLIIKEYKKPKYNISAIEFYNHCKNNNS